MKCKYFMAWIGTCSVESNKEYCPKHRLECASCGSPAVRECDHTGQFVCGAPLCGSCEGRGGDFNRGLGWGFMGHKHVKKNNDKT